MGEFDDINPSIDISNKSPENRGEEKEMPPSALDNALESQAKKGKHKRHQHFQGSLNCIVILALWSIFFAVLVCGAVYLWHMITPECKHFLAQAQLDQIRTFVVTAILSSSLTNYANRHINEE